VSRFVRHARHYFRAESQYGWSFFHNSFRVFLQAQTSRDFAGIINKDLDRGWHRRLADFAASSAAHYAFSWEQLYHRAASGDHDAVLHLGAQGQFRHQYTSGRALDDILSDLTLVLRSALERKDGCGVIRALLIEAELRSRADKCAGAQIEDLLLELDGYETAVAHIAIGRKLRGPRREALKFCGRLLKEGFRDAAAQIFELAEPLGQLAGSEPVELTGNGNIEELKEWASIAVHFRSLDKILDAIGQLKAAVPIAEGKIDDRHARVPILSALLEAIAYEGNAELLAELREKLLARGDPDGSLPWLDFYECEAWFTRPGSQNHDRVAAALARLRAAAITCDSNWLRIAVAEFLLRISGDQQGASALIEGVEQPSAFDPRQHGWHINDLSPFTDRIRLNRLLTALGKEPHRLGGS
jgi:hypothetical protein